MQTLNAAETTLFEGANTGSAARRTHRFAGFEWIVDSAVAFVASLTHVGSIRRGVPGKERASGGIAPVTNLVVAESTSRQIEATRLRSQAGLPGAANAALARPALLSPRAISSRPPSSMRHW